ncbi:hypothetical protein MYX76_17170, partial [Desulfobacterota bacterium AH_259_B03_O07]|nr:hypothetical protein [Desulfobacterota bacterium AH_259_B03_O07]
MIDKLPLQKISTRIFVILFLLINCLILGTNANALVYCVTDGLMGSGCSTASAATCTGGTACGADCTSAGHICTSITDALMCIAANADAAAIVRVGSGTHVGPGTTGVGAGLSIINSLGAAQDIDILGGFASSCTPATRTLNPANTIIQAAAMDRVFHIDNTTNFSLDVTLEGFTITGGNPSGSCGLSGGGVCVTSTGGTGDVIFTGNLNIYDNNDADAGGGGVSIIADTSGGNINASFEQDIITFNDALGGAGGGILIDAGMNKTVTASLSRTEIGNNTASTFGGGIALTGNGIIDLDPIVNNVIHNNIAFGAEGGGAVAATTTAGSSNYSLNFVNNTLSDNMAVDAGALGGAILVDNDLLGMVNLTLPNDIVKFNASTGEGDQVALTNTGASATIAIRFSDIGQGVGNTDIVGIGDGVGFVNLIDPNFDVNPQFVDRFNNNYRLEPESQIADAGTGTAVTTVAGEEADPPSDDFDGDPRPPLDP